MVRLVLDDKQWAAFCRLLERPTQEKPRLRALFQEPHVAVRRADLGRPAAADGVAAGDSGGR